jgi:AraC family transcriptional regulator
MLPIIKLHPAITLIGKRQEMTFANDLSVAMWQAFMPRRHEIKDRLGEELYSVQVYPEAFDFGMDTLFSKWASVPVPSGFSVPAGMEVLFIPEGIYAVFTYQGIPAHAESFFRSIFTEWLPASDYILDNRPHFELLGSLYKHNDPTLEETVWIPVRLNKGA